MARVISFEGCVGAGKTSLTNYFSRDLRLEKILEEYKHNPFLKSFYQGSNIGLEVEITFVLIHFWQLKEAEQRPDRDEFILADFSIEKDLVYAVLNLDGDELEVFREVYDYVIQQVGLPEAVIYIDLTLDILKRRIFQRGRPYEMDADPAYFKDYNGKVKEFFEKEAGSTVFFFDVDDVELEPENEKLEEIRKRILDLIR